MNQTSYPLTTLIAHSSLLILLCCFVEPAQLRLACA
jgi:hypothetical protein